MKRLMLLFSLALAVRARAQVVVEDPFVVAQQLIQLARQGDPAAIQRLPGVNQLLRSLANPGVGQTFEALQQAASAARAFTYDADGLYSAVNDRVITANAKEIPRAEDLYKQFDAVIRMVADYKAVHEDTESRRKELRDEIRATTAEAQSALTQTLVDKLKVVVTAQNAELAAIDRERDAALSRVMVQDIQNRNDAARQQEARKEDRAVAFQEANDNLANFLKPDTTPLTIPAPGSSKH
jgi:hypothetical protein